MIPSDPDITCPRCLSRQFTSVDTACGLCDGNGSVSKPMAIEYALISDKPDRWGMNYATAVELRKRYEP